MERKVEEILKQILAEGTKDGRAMTEDELIRELNRVPGFWEVAAAENFEFKELKGVVQEQPDFSGGILE